MQQKPCNIPFFIFFCHWWQSSFFQELRRHENRETIRSPFSCRSWSQVSSLHCKSDWSKDDVCWTEGRFFFFFLGPLAESSGGMKRWTCSAKLLLSVCMPFWQTRGCARARGEKWTYAPSFRESVIVSGCSPAERERKRKRESENNKMHPVQPLTSVCFCVTAFKTRQCAALASLRCHLVAPSRAAISSRWH